MMMTMNKFNILKMTMMININKNNNNKYNNNKMKYNKKDILIILITK